LAEPQRFEGASIEAVLAEVRSALGPDADIVEANKIRSGGIGGFFAREAYEVLALPAPPGGVELPGGIDPAVFDRAAAHVAAAVTPGASLLDLAEQVSDAERQIDEPPAMPVAAAAAQAGAALAGQPRSRAELVAQQAMREHLSRAVDPTTTPPGGLADGATPARRAAQDVAEAFHAARQDPRLDGTFEPMATQELPRLSTEVPAFTDVLQRIAADAGPEATREVDHRIAAAMAAHPDRDRLAPAPAAPPAPAPAADLAPAPAAAPAADRAADRAADGAADRADEPGAAVALREPMAPAPTPARQAEVQVDRTARLLSWLERDNLPRTTLMTALRSLPALPALPETTGIVVAVVGERREALRLCRALAKACDGDAGDVVLASQTYTGNAIAGAQRIVDVTDATRERLSWRRRSRPTFVAVECPTAVRGDGHGWTRAVVDALEARRVIGVVSASRKVEDVARWIDLVGGVDGLALRGLAETSTPYAVLALEIPVTHLDDVIATAGTWAQALLEETPA
jgi:hypothetical protein